MFSCDGTTGFNTVLVAAAEQAYEDGMDIINMCAFVSSFFFVASISQSWSRH